MNAKQRRQWKVWVAVVEGRPSAHSCRDTKREVVAEVQSKCIGIVPDYITIERATLTLSKPRRKAK